MADSKLEIKVGSVTFSGEGTGDWLSKQLDKVLAKIPELIAVAPLENTGTPGDGHGDRHSGSGTPGGKVAGTLAAFLRAASVGTNQNQKFLATAVWLHDTEKKSRLTTTEVSGALSKHSQGKLTNPALNLKRNIGKGFCVREGKQFYVTNEGRESVK